MKFTKKQEFIEAQRHWDQLLKKKGFQDIEDRSGNLKGQIKPTISWQNQDLIRNFFLTLDNLLTVYTQMPAFERKVLELYTQGMRIKMIVKKTHASDRHVRNVITRYKHLCMAIQKML